jgi:hypothetical protein
MTSYGDICNDIFTCLTGLNFTMKWESVIVFMVEGKVVEVVIMKFRLAVRTFW